MKLPSALPIPEKPVVPNEFDRPSQFDGSTNARDLARLVKGSGSEGGSGCVVVTPDPFGQ